MVDESLEGVGQDRLTDRFVALQLPRQKSAVAQRNAALEEILFGERGADQIRQYACGHPVTFQEIPQQRSVLHQPVVAAPAVAARPDAERTAFVYQLRVSQHLRQRLVEDLLERAIRAEAELELEQAAERLHAVPDPERALRSLRGGQERAGD